MSLLPPYDLVGFTNLVLFLFPFFTIPITAYYCRVLIKSDDTNRKILIGLQLGVMISLAYNILDILIIKNFFVYCSDWCGIENVFHALILAVILAVLFIIYTLYEFKRKRNQDKTTGITPGTGSTMNSTETASEAGEKHAEGLGFSIIPLSFIAIFLFIFTASTADGSNILLYVLPIVAQRISAVIYGMYIVWASRGKYKSAMIAALVAPLLSAPFLYSSVLSLIRIVSKYGPGEIIELWIIPATIIGHVIFLSLVFINRPRGRY